MKGLDLLREIKKDMDLSRIPVIVLTSDTESEVDSLLSGASDFIPKPYPRQEIVLARIRRSIELSENRDLIRWTERDLCQGSWHQRSNPRRPCPPSHIFLPFYYAWSDGSRPLPDP